MKPLKLVRAGNIDNNLTNARQLYQTQANILKKLIEKTDAIDKDIISDRTTINTLTASNKETFANLQNEITKLKSTTSSIVSADINKTKTALDELSATVSTLISRTDNLESTDINTIRTDIATLKQTTESLSTTTISDIDKNKSDISTVSGKLSTLSTEIETFRANTLKSLSTIESNVNAIQSANITNLRQELLDIINNSIPKFNETRSTVQLELDSDSETADNIVPPGDYPFDIAQLDPNCDTFEANGLQLTSTVKNDQQIGSLTTTYGGIAIDKENSYDRWIIERNNDTQLNFHFNTEANPPLTITKKGIATNRLRIGDFHVNAFVNKITSDNINNHTIPTTKAIFDFVHANLLQSHTAHPFHSPSNSSLTHVSFPSPTEGESFPAFAVAGRRSSNPRIHASPSVGSANLRRKSIVATNSKCNISTVAIDGKHSLLVQNDSCSVSLKDDNNIFTLTPSVVDGLRINDSFKLINDGGVLCYVDTTTLPKDVTVDDMLGRFVACTRDIKVIQPPDEHGAPLYVPVIKVPTDVTSTIFGIAHNVIDDNTYTKGNRIYDLSKYIEYTDKQRVTHSKTKTTRTDTDINVVTENTIVSDHIQTGYFVIVKIKGIVLVKTTDDTIKCGTVFAPTKNGNAQKIGDDKSGTKLSKFCLLNSVPRVKAIRMGGDNTFIGFLL